MRDAICALREVNGHSHEANVTRQRIVGSVIQKKRQRRQAIALLWLTLIGLPLGTTAYAAFFGTPGFVRGWLDRDVTVQAPTRTPAPNATAPTTTSTPPKATTIHAPGVVPPIPEAPIVTAPTTASTKPATRTSTRTPVTSAPITSAPITSAPSAATQEPPSTTPSAAVDPSEALYTRAHQLHFVNADPAAALAAWNAYIEQAPTTTFLPEAKYNRALCLVRLHQNREAIEALAPFAHGEFGNYRRREATALLRALSR